MYYIALKMLFGNHSKYYGMIVGIAFAAIIMTQQPSIMVGLFSRTYSLVKDISGPDIWVMDKGVNFIEDSKPIRDTDLSIVRGIKGVAFASPLIVTPMSAKLPDGSTQNLIVVGVDGSTMYGAPSNLIEGTQLNDLKEHNAIFVDKNGALEKLNFIDQVSGKSRPLTFNDTIEINDHKAIIRGKYYNHRTFTMQAGVYTTYERALNYMPSKRNMLNYILVKAQSDKGHEELARLISTLTGLKALTKEEFAEENLNYWMKSTGILINFGITVLMGFIIGAAVSGQTFYNFVQENLNNFAALKAMGLSSNKLRKMIMLQAIVVGFIGYGIGVGLTTLFGLRFHQTVLAFRMSPQLPLFSLIAILIIVSIAGYYGARQVIKVDPSIVFRS